MRPSQTPIGLLVAQAAKKVSRAFENRLGEAGGSLPLWLVLLTLMRGGHTSQARIAEEIGIRGPTLTHHLNGMEADGLITRSRSGEDRRVHDVALTDAGRNRFHQLREAAAKHDGRLQSAFSPDELERLREFMIRLMRAVEENSSEEKDA